MSDKNLVMESIINELFETSTPFNEPNKKELYRSTFAYLIIICLIFTAIAYYKHLLCCMAFVPIGLYVYSLKVFFDKENTNRKTINQKRNILKACAVLVLTVAFVAYINGEETKVVLQNLFLQGYLIMVLFFYKICSNYYNQFYYRKIFFSSFQLILAFVFDFSLNFVITSFIIHLLYEEMSFLIRKVKFLNDKRQQLKQLYDMFNSLFNNINSGLVIIHGDKIKVLNSYLQQIVNRKESSEFSFKENETVLTMAGETRSIDYLDNVFSLAEDIKVTETLLFASNKQISQNITVYNNNDISKLSNRIKSSSKNLPKFKPQIASEDSLINLSNKLSNDKQENLGFERTCSNISFNKQNDIIFLGQYKLNNSPESTRRFEIYKKADSNSKCDMSQLFIYEVTKVLDEAKYKAELKFKNIFLSKMAHEIKTPCIAINCLATNTEISTNDCVKIFALSDMVINLVSEIHIYINGLENISINNSEFLVEDLVKWSHAVLEAILSCDTYKSNIKTKIKVGKNINKDKMKHFIYTDERKLKVIIAHIIKNALKFTTKGEITICLSESYKEGYICIIIEDTGVGISPNRLSQLLSDESKIEDMNDLFVKQGGLGIGLKIVKGLCKKLNIEFKMISKENEGTKIFLDIPVYNTNRNISTNTFYVQDFETVSNISRKSSKKPINLLFYPNPEAANLSNDDFNFVRQINVDGGFKNKHKTINYVRKKDSDCNLDSKLVNDEVKPLEKNINLINLSKKLEIKNTFVESGEISENQENKPIRENKHIFVDIENKLNGSLVPIDEETKEFNMSEENVNKAEEETSFLHKNYQILEKLNSKKFFKEKKDKELKEEKKLKNLTSVSKIEHRNDESDSGGWNARYNYDRANSGVNSGVCDSDGARISRKDTIFLDIKNISGELGYYNTKLSNNSIFPFKMSNLNINKSKNVQSNSIPSIRGSKKSVKFSNKNVFSPTIERSKNEEDDDATVKYNGYTKSVRSNKTYSMNSSGDDSPILTKDEKLTSILKNPKPMIQMKNSNTEELQVLIVDDVSFCRNQIENMINSYIKDKGIKLSVIHEDDGLGTINRVLNDKANKLELIKLIISDENMYYINGSDSFQILSLIEDKKTMGRIPKVILTAIEDSDHLVQLKKKSKADLICSKPLSKSKLAEIFKLMDIGDRK